MRLSTVFLACVLVSTSLTWGMSIIPSHDMDYYPSYHKPEAIPVIYKKVDSVLPFLFAVLLSQLLPASSSSTNTTDTATLASNGITVVTSNPCCG